MRRVISGVPTLGYGPDDRRFRYDVEEHQALPHVVKFSGGRSSALLLFVVLESGLLDADRGDVVVFNNTSAEHPETYRFARECKKRVEDGYGVSFFWIEFQAYDTKNEEEETMRIKVQSAVVLGGALLALVLCAAPADAQRASSSDLCNARAEAGVAQACWSIDTGEKVTKWGGILAGAASALLTVMVARHTDSDAAVHNAAIAGTVATSTVTLIGVAMQAKGYRDLAHQRTQGSGARGIGVAYNVAW